MVTFRLLIVAACMAMCMALGACSSESSLERVQQPGQASVSGLELPPANALERPTAQTANLPAR
jgi:hypothetical protein